MTRIRPETIPYHVAPPAPLYASLRSGAVAFGVISIVLGAGCGCLGLLAPLALVVPRRGQEGPPPSGELIGSVLVCLATAAGLIWLGIGAARLRRWVRPVVLTAGTLTVVSGAFSVVMIAVTAPAARQSIENRSQGLPANAIQFALFLTLACFALFTVALPAAFVWFFRKANVEAMLNHFDPEPRWTDRSPIPVLGVSVALVFYAISPLSAVPERIAPVFGTVLTGLPAVATDLALAAIALALAWITFRRSRLAWWGVLSFAVAASAAYAMTLAHADYLVLFRRAGFTERQLAAVQPLDSLGPGGRLATATIALMVAIGYLIYVKSYFKSDGFRTNVG